jgi:hypothetical protein
MHAGKVAYTLACDPLQGVGKTSLITAAATESFPDFPPPVLPPTRLPAEATPEGVPMIITDTSSREEEKTSLDVSGCGSTHVLTELLLTCHPADLNHTG